MIRSQCGERRRMALGFAFAAFASTAGCTDAAPSGEAPVTTPCPSGSVVGPDGDCMPVGIQGCAAMFLEEDGLCHPSMGKCPAGQIPKFDEGCVPVGIQSCAAVFVEDDGLCHPSMSKCPPGTYALPQEGCVPIDGPEGCGTGTFGNVADGMNTFYVDSAAAPGGDGSKDKPFTTIASAIAKAPSGGRVVLAAGEYDEPLDIDKPLTVIGRCPSMVGIHGVTNDVLSAPTLLRIRNTTDVLVERVRASGPGRGLRFLDAKGTARHVVIDGAAPIGMVVEGAETDATLEHVLVANTAPDAENPNSGWGVSVRAGARLTGSHVSIVENRDVALLGQDGGTTIALTDALIEGTLPRAESQHEGHGIDMLAGAKLTLTSSAVARNHDAGVVAEGSGSAIMLDQSLVEETLPDASTQGFGRGVNVNAGASLKLLGSALVRNREVGLSGTGDGTEITVEGSLIANTQTTANDGNYGLGIRIADGATLTLQDSTVRGNRWAGVIVKNSGTSIAVVRSVIADTQSDDPGKLFGVGLVVDTGPTAELRDSALLGNRSVGALFRNLLGVTIEGALVADTQPISDGSYGMGMIVSSVPATLERALFARNQTAGVLVSGSVATIASVMFDTVREGRFHSYSGSVENPTLTATFEGVGDGIVAGFESAVDVTNVVVRDAARAGVVFDSSGGVLRSVRAEGGRFGLIVQGNPKPDGSDEQNAFVGSDENILSDAELPVPGAPPIPSQ